MLVKDRYACLIYVSLPILVSFSPFSRHIPTPAQNITYDMHNVIAEHLHPQNDEEAVAAIIQYARERFAETENARLLIQLEPADVDDHKDQNGDRSIGMIRVLADPATEQAVARVNDAPDPSPLIGHVVAGGIRSASGREQSHMSMPIASKEFAIRGHATRSKKAAVQQQNDSQAVDRIKMLASYLLEASIAATTPVDIAVSDAGRHGSEASGSMFSDVGTVLNDEGLHESSSASSKGQVTPPVSKSAAYSQSRFRFKGPRPATTTSAATPSSASPTAINKSAPNSTYPTTSSVSSGPTIATSSTSPTFTPINPNLPITTRARPPRHRWSRAQETLLTTLSGQNIEWDEIHARYNAAYPSDLPRSKHSLQQRVYFMEVRKKRIAKSLRGKSVMGGVGGGMTRKAYRIKMGVAGNAGASEGSENGMQVDGVSGVVGKDDGVAGGKDGQAGDEEREGGSGSEENGEKGDDVVIKIE